MVHQGKTVEWSHKVIQRYTEDQLRKLYKDAYPAGVSHDTVKASYKQLASKNNCRCTQLDQSHFDEAAISPMTGQQLRALWKEVINNPPEDFEDSDEEE